MIAQEFSVRFFWAGHQEVSVRWAGADIVRATKSIREIASDYGAGIASKLTKLVFRIVYNDGSGAESVFMKPEKIEAILADPTATPASFAADMVGARVN